MKIIYNRSFCAILLLMSFSPAMAQDSLPAASGIGPLVQENEMLADLSVFTSTVQEVIVPQGKKIRELVPEGLEVNDRAQLIVTDPSLLTENDYVIDLKVATTDGSYYNTTIRLTGKGNRLTTAIITDKIEMADGWRKDGKIYVVIAVSLTLFAVIILFLVSLDRKTRKLKKQLPESTRIS